MNRLNEVREKNSRSRYQDGDREMDRLKYVLCEGAVFESCFVALTSLWFSHMYLFEKRKFPLGVREHTETGLIAEGCCDSLPCKNTCAHIVRKRRGIFGTKRNLSFKKKAGTN
jgi:hypothetical protein